MIVIHNLDIGLVNGMSCKPVGLNDAEIEVEVESDKYLHRNVDGKKFKFNRCKFILN